MAGDGASRNTTSTGRVPPAGGADATAPSGRRLHLVVLGPAGGGEGERRTLDTANLLLGRAPDCDVVLEEPSVSARHARIDVAPDGAFVTDLGSTNGTFAAGRRVTGSVELAVGDVLTLGRCKLRVEAGGHLPAAPVGGPATEERADRRGGAIPARRKLNVLASFDQADVEVGNRVVERLERIGHRVALDRSADGDGWNGRLLDAVWSSDVVVFVVSRAAAASERVHREVHLAGSERTAVIPILVDDVELPDDLEFYVTRREPVDLRRDEAAGLSELQRRLEEVPRKRIARPRRLLRRIVVGVIVVVLVVLVYRFLRG